MYDMAVTTQLAIKQLCFGVRGLFEVISNRIS